MVITDSQIESVLRTYSRQLARSKLAGRPSKEEPSTMPSERVTISAAARERLLMERAKAQAMEQIDLTKPNDVP